ncbi:MAG: ATP-binding protein [Pseudohongiellaceae bacterium]|nr:ATP-binding protein [Pseudohongiellaceae bacterium]
MPKGKLVFFCGKMGAGKTTKAKELAKQDNAVLLSEDEWLASLYPNQIGTVEDYIKYSNQLKPQMKKLVQSILNTGSNVVMDFPANTVAQRDWFRSIFASIGADHQMIYLEEPDEVCIERVLKRAVEQPERAATDTEGMFKAVTKHFVAPTAAEGFNITTR